ncbi:hypothetical protein HGD87_02710 [Rhodobacteraceae bacterium R_SAG9]|nr:hypothetical protein [Rhodobacteraceae bacterium R_SAG9]
MSETTSSEPMVAETAAEESADKKSPKTLTAKRVKRRMEKIGTSRQPQNLRKKRAKFAQTVLHQIASGQIKNPQAAANAFVDAMAQQDAALAAVAQEANSEASVETTATN